MSPVAAVEGCSDLSNFVKSSLFRGGGALYQLLFERLVEVGCWRLENQVPRFHGEVGHK